MSTSPAPLPIRPLLAADLNQAHALTQALRWPHRREDWALALAMGEGWAISAEDRLLGTAMGWAFGPARGCFGLLVVAADQQGRGLGARLMDTALDSLGARAVQLHATPAGQKLYRRLGFAPVGLVRQHQGACVAPPPPDLPGLRPAVAGDLAELAALDLAATGMARGRVLRAILDQGTGVVLDTGGAPRGFAMLRAFGRGEVIGPVIAADAAIAWGLISHLLARRAGAFLRIDVGDAALCPLLAAHGLVEVDAALCMVRGEPATPGAVRSFALINQAMG